MALYVAGEIEDGAIDYKAFFSIPRYASLKEPVDAILVADGKQDLIVSIA